MSVEFIKSDVGKIPKYVDLYRRCFKSFPLNKNSTYFEWLYKNNPAGKFIGIDAIDSEKNLEIGQVGGIPYEFNYLGKKIKILQSINVCVDQNYRGLKLFKKMANKLETYAKEENYSLIIAVANTLATPAWINSISMKFISKLDVLLTYNDLGIQKTTMDENIFRSLWNEDLINWRRKNPYNKVIVTQEQNIKLSSPSVLSIFKVFSYIEKNNYPIEFDKKKKNILPNLFLGFIPKKNKFNNFFKVPEFLKPSPLNFLYKNITEKNIELKKEDIYFTYIDFDAY